MKFSEAEHCFRQASEIAVRDRGPQSSLAAIPAVLSAHQLYEMDQMDAAEALLVNRLDAINATGFLDCELRAYTVLVRIAYRKKDNALAHRLLDMGDVVAATENWPRMQAALLVERMRLFLDEDRVDAAEGCLRGLEALGADKSNCEKVRLIHISAYLQFARVFLQLRRGAEEGTADSLELTWQGLVGRGNAFWGARVGMLQAVTWFAAGCVEKALSRFDEVLASAFPAEMVRTIVDVAPEVGALIAARRGRGDLDGAMAAYLGRLAEAFEDSWQGVEVRPASEAPVDNPLTTREVEVLKLIAEGQSNKTIAQALSVSPETVKSHVKNIFLKLEVENRMLAVSRAQRLKLFG